MTSPPQGARAVNWAPQPGSSPQLGSVCWTRPTPARKIRLMGLEVKRSDQGCGATVGGVDLSMPLAADQVKQLRALWLEHHVLSFPGQDLDDDDLERFTQYFGPFGDDPYIKPIPDRKHVIAVRRDADEEAPLFAENWHTDWSFQQRPPAGTCLYGITIPPHGGNTHFANQHAALDAMPESLRSPLEGKQAIHSARGGYAPDGAYGEADQGTDRSMDIISSDEALATQLHPIIRRHDETGRLGLYGCIGYVIGIEGMKDDEANELLAAWYHWQTREEFVYSHAWEPDMLVMWDNRSLLHRATGGYDGYERHLHRTTIGAIPEGVRHSLK